MATPPPVKDVVPPKPTKSRRQSNGNGNLTNYQRKVICEFYRKSGGVMSQKDLAQWTKHEFGLKKTPAQSTISGILRRQHEFINMSSLELGIKKRRVVQHPQLDSALANWAMKWAAASWDEITTETIKRAWVPTQLDAIRMEGQKEAMGALGSSGDTKSVFDLDTAVGADSSNGSTSMTSLEVDSQQHMDASSLLDSTESSALSAASASLAEGAGDHTSSMLSGAADEDRPHVNESFHAVI
ncbi:hypothetical protein PC112_g10830 [Phytophthora cactorum]|nr:hypothetical protein PC112_g10830 [Phytophthora cactorum]